MNPVELVEEFWRLMNSGDFGAIRSVVTKELVVEWPQSRERIRGVENYVAVNADYPSSGKWEFTVHKVFGAANDVVSDVSFTDSVQFARAISFFTITEERISKIVEFFPDPYDPPANRSHLTEPLV